MHFIRREIKGDGSSSIVQIDLLFRCVLRDTVEYIRSKTPKKFCKYPPTHLEKLLPILCPTFEYDVTPTYISEHATM